MSSHPVTRMVHMMSAAHSTKESVRTGRMTIHDVARRTIFAPRYFPKFLACVMTVSGLAGYYYMESIHTRKLKRQDELHQIALENNLQSPGRSQAAVNRMIQKARSSSWQEKNLENATKAQDRFMELGAQPRVTRRITLKAGTPGKLMKRLTVQTKELMNYGVLDPQS